MALFKRGSTSADQTPPDTVETAGSTAARAPISAPKRRTGALALSAALAVLGGLLMWWFQQSTEAGSYLAVNRAVERGERIEQSMLTTLDVVGEPAHLIPVEKASEVIGQVAIANLAEGTPVTGGNTAAQLGVSEGRTVVGVALAPGRLPARELEPGDRVQVIYTPSNDAPNPGTTNLAPVSGTVEGTSRDDATGHVIVDLNLSQADAATVAAWGAKDSASVVLGTSSAPAATQPAPEAKPSKAAKDAPASPTPAPSSSAAPASSASPSETEADQ